MQALFSLANNPDRLMRLINHLLDKGFAVTSHCKPSALRQSVKGVFTICFDESSEIALIDELPCQHIQVNLVSNSPDLELIRLILEAGGEICEEPAEADLIVCDTGEIHELSRQHPRKLVIGESELSALLNDSLRVDLLRAPVNPDLTPVPPLPESLKACWAKLRRRSIPTINEGLDLLDALLQADHIAGDPLLDQVEVVDGELFPGRRFRLSDAFTHPYSYYALLGILSRSPAGSRGEALRLGVKALDTVEVIALPELKSFENLEKVWIRILEPDRAIPSPRLSAYWSGLSCLTELSLSIADGVVIQFDHLDAPNLNVLTLDGAEFKEIDGVSQCPHLSTMDISSTSITELAPLSGICKSLRSINLSCTNITTLEPLAACQQLEDLNIDNCAQLPSLRGLEQVAITGDILCIRNAPIHSLQSFPSFEGDCLDLWNLPLSNLKGIDKARNLKRLQLIELQSLTSIEDLQALSTIEEIIITRCGSLVDLGVLGSLRNLRRVSISGCTKLVSMPERWPDSLRHLSLSDLATRQIGDLPSAYEEDLSLQTVHGLETVENLRNSVKIQEISLTMSQIPAMNDLTPFANYQDLWLNIKMESKSSLPDVVVEMLSELPVCRLRLDDYEDIDLTNLTRLENLVALDLDVNYMWIKKDELRPIINMNALEYLQFPAGSLPELGGCTFNTASKVAKLKMQLLVS